VILEHRTASQQQQFHKRLQLELQQMLVQEEAQLLPIQQMQQVEKQFLHIQQYLLQDHCLEREQAQLQFLV
jgi:hypothetical protein